MNAEKRFFYVVYVPESEEQMCLDAIRLLARPRARFPAHVTVRGPYSNPVDAGDADERIRGAIVRVADIGTFLGPAQNTVFLHCSCPEFLPFWHKPDYAAYRPHITLYDADSRGFAESFRDVVKRYRIRFTFRAKGLELLESTTGDSRSPLRDRFDPRALADVLGEEIHLTEIDAADERRRLDWIDRLARHLSVCGKPVALA